MMGLVIFIGVVFAGGWALMKHDKKERVKKRRAEGRAQAAFEKRKKRVGKRSAYGLD